jgi:hypothetical protein
MGFFERPNKDSFKSLASLEGNNTNIKDSGKACLQVDIWKVMGDVGSLRGGGIITEKIEMVT